MDSLWKAVVTPRLEAGAKVESKEGVAYTLSSFDGDGFTLQREGETTVRVTSRMVEEAARRLANGDSLSFNTAEAKGGISSTSAIEAGVVWALADRARPDPLHHAFVPGDRRLHWWVNQGKTFREELAAGLIWAPQEAEDGKAKWHHRNVLHVRPGDLIFSYVKGSLRAASLASGSGHPANRPQFRKSASSLWKETGWQAEVSYSELVGGPSIGQLSSALRTSWGRKHGPLNRTGSGNQNYLQQLTREEVAAIVPLLNLAELPDGVVSALSEAGKGLEASTVTPGRQISSMREAIQALMRAAEARSLQYDEEVLEAFLLSLKTKPFCLLAGATGTGKSRLGRLLEDLGARVRVEPVEPSWTDGTSVVGYRDLDQIFRPGVLTAHARRALAEPQRVHVLVLDELNLARVEHYLAQWLSVMESRTLEPEGLKADHLFNDECDARDTVALPANLFVVGTVNMDESTFAFSQRVLDRANAIALPSPTTLRRPGAQAKIAAPELLTLRPDVLAPRAISWRDLVNTATSEHLAEIERLIDTYLEPTQALLKKHKARARISFRLLDEIAAYLLHGLEAGAAGERLVDQQLRQRLLPKLCDGYSRLSEDFVKGLLKTWDPLGSADRPSSAADLLRSIHERQQEDDMPVSVWTALA